MLRQITSGVLLSLCVLVTICSCHGGKRNTKQERTIVEINSDTISIGKEFTIYKMPYAYDHSIIYNTKNKKWHLYGIEAGNKSFIHLSKKT